MDVSEARRLKALEDENAKLKKLLAEAMLDNAMLKDIAFKKMVTPVAKRQAVAHLCQRYRGEPAPGVPGDRRRSDARCAIAAARPDDGAMRARLRELAAVRRRFGYRRLHDPAPTRGNCT